VAPIIAKRKPAIPFIIVPSPILLEALVYAIIKYFS
jgi:hypothetical protein